MTRELTNTHVSGSTRQDAFTKGKLNHGFIMDLAALLTAAGPHAIMPTVKRPLWRYASWDNINFTSADKATAFNLGWLLTGIPVDDETEEEYSARKDRLRRGPYNVGPVREHDMDDPKFETTETAWLICTRVGYLFNLLQGVSDER